MKIPFVPASFFGIVLGLAGLGQAWRAAAQVWPLPHAIGEAVLAVAAAVWLTLVFSTVAKWIVHRASALDELRHPIQCCFAGLIFVTTLLIALAAAPYLPFTARALACIGAIGQLAFGVWRGGGLWRGERSEEHSTAVMYLPLIGGNLVTAIAAGALGAPDWGRLFFGAGVLSWMALESVVLHRLYVAAPLAPTLRTTLGIQLAPPVVTCVAWLSINGNIADTAAQMLWGYGLLQGLMLLRLGGWLRGQAFGPAVWAYTFGLAALALSGVRMTAAGVGGPIALLAAPVFVCANVVIGLLTLGTLRSLIRRTLLPRAPTASLTH